MGLAEGVVPLCGRSESGLVVVGDSGNGWGGGMVGKEAGEASWARVVGRRRSKERRNVRRSWNRCRSRPLDMFSGRSRRGRRHTFWRRRELAVDSLDGRSTLIYMCRCSDV